MENMMKLESRVYVAGNRGLVGSALIRVLSARGYNNLLMRSHSELELMNQDAVDHFFADVRPDYVFLAAARVGGILANSVFPAEFIHQNLAVQTNVLESAYRHGV